MKSKLKGNVTIKIFAVLAAILLWLYIQMVQNPDIEYTFHNMKVSQVNSSLLEANNLVVIDDKEYTSDITVRCPRWNLNELDKEDFVAYVDLSEIKTSGTFEMPVKVRINNENVIISDKNPSTVSITVDRIKTVEKELIVHISGKLKEGYYTNDKLIVPEKTSFSVKGPESIINKIYNGVISVELKNKSEDFSDSYSIILVSEDGTAVSNELLTVLDNNINVDVTVYEKKVLPIEISGISEDIKYDIKPASIEIAGPSEVIDAMDKILVEDFTLRSKEVGYEQSVELNLDDKIILLNDAQPVVVIKE